ncbi:glycosyltransferase family 4 protein [Paenibacillus lautus]|uniref:glycosyltransferase family 4 protein n=1 Tax=Paenibacillus lautus TaxID=1401 RepID=UPI002040DC8A|nr:glycosyltransferase family 4 protein [Paenibacillus lautus]MCM3261598.1 glycosyltransferase family 4 protein [Paenibacillus lautus]
MGYKIHQVIDALDYGDAVSNHCLELQEIFNEFGIPNTIYSKFYNEKVAKHRLSIEKIKVAEEDVLIFHFSGKSVVIEDIVKLSCKKIMIYHNITPHYYFEGMEPHYTHCLEGRQQLVQLSEKFDLYVGVSEYNVMELSEIGCSPCAILPITVDLEIKNTPPRNKGVVGDGRKFIFVGRVAPNKRHEDVLNIFEYYYTYINTNSELFLIGNYSDYELYYKRLVNIVDTLNSKERITFTGKVTSEELDYHYKSADAFISMSEHEGFCVPLLESMSYGVPTFAYSAGAIDSTIGNAGIKILLKDTERIAELIDYVIENKKLEKEVIDKQYDWLNNFSVSKTKIALRKILDQVKKNDG